MTFEELERLIPDDDGCAAVLASLEATQTASEYLERLEVACKASLEALSEETKNVIIHRLLQENPNFIEEISAP